MEEDKEGDELMAPPPPSSLHAGLPAGSSGGGEGRERGGRVSGATIRDTLIGVLRPLSKTQTHVKATGPTKAPGLLPNPEERKGLKEAQHVAHSHPSQAHRTISASLEGSGSTLERVTHLRLARGLPPGPSTA